MIIVGLRTRLRILSALAVIALAGLASHGSAYAATGIRAYIPNFNDHNVSVIDIASHATVGAPIPVGLGPIGVTVSRDGLKVYVTNSSDGTISVIDTTSDTVSATFAAPSVPQGVVVSPDGSTLYVCGFFGVLDEISTATGTVLASNTFNTACGALAITPDGAKLYMAGAASTVSNSHFNSVFVYSTTSHAVTSEIALDGPGSVNGMAMSPDGARLYATMRATGTLIRISTATDSVLGSSFANAAFGVAVSQDNRRLYVSGFTSDALMVLSAVDGSPIASIPAGVGPSGVSVSPDGATVAVANQIDGTVTLASTATNAVIATVPVGRTPQALGSTMVMPLNIVPTLSETALAALMLTLAATGALVLVRRGRFDLNGDGSGGRG